ncbi:MAG: PLP-dependent transferase, partial [Steroidobacteraceae bacterium]
YEVDVFVHSLTKYASGAGDVMGGAVIASKDIIHGLRADFGVLGAVLDPHAAFLIQRGLKTYFVRYRAQCAAAQRIAERLAAHPAVERAHYPGLRSHPQHELARAQMQEFGAVVSFDLRAGSEAAARFVDALTLFALTPSLGSTESLVIAPQMMGVGDLTPQEARLSGITPGTVRLAIGLEDPEDLEEDVTRALEAAAG